MAAAFNQAWQIFERGGALMWPLLALSLLAVTLLVERVWFFIAINRPSQQAAMQRLAAAMRAGDVAVARNRAQSESGFYARVSRRLTAEQHGSPALASETLEAARPAVERFMPTLSTIITAAPLIGILGTVLGIIRSFNVISAQQTRIDLNDLAAGIAEALITTGAGLTVAILTVFPYNALRTQVDRTLSRIEMLCASSVPPSDASAPTADAAR